MTDPVRLFVTGGTFDKEYDERTGTLYFKDTHVRDILKLARCRVPVEVRTLMMVDSQEMSDADRLLIAHNCAEAPEPHIVITHGTASLSVQRPPDRIRWSQHPLS